MAVPKTEATIGLQRRFAENAVLLRNRADFSQVAAAERSGLHVTQISLLERGLRLPRLDTIVKLAGALGVEPCELLAGMTWRLARTVERPGSYAPQGAFEVATAERAESS
jgi:transcriptional regulator with XRE-family HTH domain